MIIDKPSPSMTYVLFNIIFLILFLLGPFILNHFIKFRLPLLICLIMILWGTAGVMGLVVHAAHNTEYSMDETTLTLQCGYMMDEKIALDKIHDIRPVMINFQTMGWSTRWRGFCNRFGNGLKISVNGIRYYISPENPQHFLNELRTKTKMDSES